MKRKSLAIALITIFVGLFSLSSNAASQNNPVGKWKFSAPDAPYGYEAGTMEVKKEDDKYTVVVVFTGFEYKFEGELVNFVDSKLSFSIFVEGEDVFFAFNFKEEDKLVGMASYSGGDLSITASREEE
jgi:hypothetical protein